MVAPRKQTAVQVVAKGENYHDLLRVTTQPVVPPEKGEVLVKILLRPINPADVYKITGANPVDVPFGWNPGNEGDGRFITRQHLCMIPEEMHGGGLAMQRSSLPIALSWQILSV